MAKRLFISDVHVGAGRCNEGSREKGPYKHDWDWLSTAETDNFDKFLQHLCATLQKDDEVVLVGDIFDNWVFPHDIAPPTMDELISAAKNAQVKKCLNDLASVCAVFYIPGNHDMDATREVIAGHFPRFTYCPDAFQTGRVLAEHGHRYALFNAPARFSSNLWGLPLGYFISRMEATKKASTNREGRNYKTYVDDLLEMFGSATLPQCVFEAVLEETGLADDETFVVRRPGGQIEAVDARKIKETYKNIYEDWPEKVISKPRAVMAELDRLDPIADRLCKNGRFKVCVLGHSHKYDIDKDVVFCDDRIYANAGYWCGSQCTYVEVEGKYEVRLMKWTRGGNVELLKKERI